MTRAIVVCPDIKLASDRRTATARLSEAVNLCGAISLDIMQGLIFSVQQVRPATVIGVGQMEQVAEQVQADDVSVVMFDCALTPMQQRNLERALKAKVIDRSALILEIFGERAQTREGALQVELAALDYQKSRLVRSWTHLERQRGGYGFLGGPGESQLETDRRLIRDRMALIKKQLEKVVRTRGLHRQVRDEVPYPTVALVGYTNAGKSTLFNKLTQADVLAEDALFATLDPTTRRVALPSGLEVLLSDTVGFISNLPTQLIAAFRATLEEVRQADLLLHVRDITHPDTQAQRDDVLAVMETLFDDPDDMPPMIEVWNKWDMAEPMLREQHAHYQENPVAVSAVSGLGMDVLRGSVDDTLQALLFQVVTYRVPLQDGKAYAWLHQHGVIEQASQDETHWRITVRLSPVDMARCEHQFSLVAETATTPA